MRIHLEKTLKRFVFGLLILCFLPILIVRGSMTALPPELGEFPAIQATSLNNAKLHLPQDFSGKLNLVVISFAREQQQQVDTWIPVARKIQSTQSSFNYYELSAMSRENLLYRWWFNAALRSDTQDIDLRSRVLTAYVSKRMFQKSLRIIQEKQVIVVLIDRTGKVYWRANGVCTEQKTAALLSALATSIQQ